MYEWLEDELKRIRWPGFHVVVACTEANALDPRLPPSYLEFVRRFGSAKLYRRDRHYQLGVLCPPEPSSVDGNDVLLVGHCTENDVAMRVEDVARGQEARIYEVIDGALEEVAFEFSDWLEACASDAREDYTAEEWGTLEQGPPPFTPEEDAIVKARREFVWELLGAGTGPKNALRFKVRNSSNRSLKAFTIGVRHRQGEVEARLPIDVSAIAPGDEKIVDVPGYVTLPADEVVAFDLPEPTPAERDLYAELATAGPMKR